MRQGAEPTPGTPVEFSAQIKADLATWSALVKSAWIKAD